MTRHSGGLKSRRLSSGSLKTRTAKAVAWTVLARMLRAAVQVGYLLILARAMPPPLFGAVVIGMIAHQLIAVLCTETVQQSLVHAHHRSDASQNAGFLIHLALCLVSALVIALSGPALAVVMVIPSLNWLLPALAVGALLAVPTCLPAARLVSDMRLDRLALIETAATVVSGIAAMAMALSGFGLASLLVFSLGIRGLEALGLAMSSPWRPKGRFEPAAARTVMRFTGPLIGVQATQFASNSIDQFFVGRILGAQALGLYGLARRLAQQPAQMLAFAVGRASFPALVLARDTNIEASAKSFLVLIRGAFWASTAAFALAAALSDPLLRATVGDAWAPAGPIVAAFCVSAALMPAGAVAGAMLRAAGRTDWQFHADMLRLLALVAALSIGLYLKLNAIEVAWMINGVNLLHFLLNISISGVASKISVTSTLTELMRGFAPTLLAIVVAVLMRSVAMPEHESEAFWGSTGAAILAWGMGSVLLNVDIVRRLLLMSSKAPRALTGKKSAETTPVSAVQTGPEGSA